MRKTIKIVGLGQRRAGVKENGKSYDFLPVSFVMHDDRYNGVYADTANVQGSDIDSVGGLTVNDEIDAFYHYSNYHVVIDGLVK